MTFQALLFVRSSCVASQYIYSYFVPRRLEIRLVLRNDYIVQILKTLRQWALSSFVHTSSIIKLRNRCSETWHQTRHRPITSFVNLALFFALFQGVFSIRAPRWCGGHAQSTRAVFMTTSDMFISFLFVITLVLVVLRSSGTRWHIPVPYAQLCFLLSRCELVTTSTAGLKVTDLYPLRWRWCFDLSAVRTYVSKSRYEEDII